MLFDQTLFKGIFHIFGIFLFSINEEIEAQNIDFPQDAVQNLSVILNFLFVFKFETPKAHSYNISFESKIEMQIPGMFQ